MPRLSTGARKECHLEIAVQRFLVISRGIDGSTRHSLLAGAALHFIIAAMSALGGLFHVTRHELACKQQPQKLRFQCNVIFPPMV